jgi:hypothetical protein
MQVQKLRMISHLIFYSCLPADEVSRHNKVGDMWIIVDDDVYDISKFAMLHPGGMPPLKETAGTDATDAFYGMHRADVMDKYKEKLLVGHITGPGGTVKETPPTAEETMVPYAEAMGFWRKHSPYYSESHHKFRAALREFIDREIAPDAAQWDEEGTRPSLELNQKMGQAGVLAAVVGSHGDELEKMGISMVGGLSYAEFDEFHELIVAEEFKRLGTYGLTDGLHGALSIGVPPLLYFGSDDLKHRIADPVLRGTKRICLAISEPYAGSDVAQIHTSAVKSADGKSWVCPHTMHSHTCSLLTPLSHTHNPCLVPSVLTFPHSNIEHPSSHSHALTPSTAHPNRS